MRDKLTEWSTVNVKWYQSFENRDWDPYEQSATCG